MSDSDDSGTNPTHFVFFGGVGGRQTTRAKDAISASSASVHGIGPPGEFGSEGSDCPSIVVGLILIAGARVSVPVGG